MNFQSQNMMMNGNTEGTPIELLRNDVIRNNRHNQDNESHYSVGSIDTSSDIRNLVNEINNNIKTKKQNEKNDDKEEDKKENEEDIIKMTENFDNIDHGDDEHSDKKKKKKKKHECIVQLEDYAYDFILLFIIFMLMSQDFVKNFIGTYVKSININEKGVVPIHGVAIYGIIFVTVFILSKIFINKISNI